MDDELPIIMYIVTQVEIKNFVAEINMIQDYLRFTVSLDNESRLLTTIIVILFFKFRELFIISHITGILIVINF